MIHINGTKQAKSTQQPKSGCYSCLWWSFLPSCLERSDSDWCLSSRWYCQDVVTVRQNKDTPKSCNISKDEEAVPEDGVRRWRGVCEKLLQPRWFTSPVQDHRQQPSHWCFSISIVCSGFSCCFFFSWFFLTGQMFCRTQTRKEVYAIKWQSLGLLPNCSNIISPPQSSRLRGRKWEWEMESVFQMAGCHASMIFTEGLFFGNWERRDKWRKDVLGVTCEEKNIRDLCSVLANFVSVKVLIPIPWG